MIRFNAQRRQTLLHHQANRAATPPQADDKRWTKTTGINPLTKTVAIQDLLIFSNKYFILSADGTLLVQGSLAY